MSGRLSVWALGLLCAVVGGLVFAGVSSANTLPDGRIYEQVTPEEKYGSDVYQPKSPSGIRENTESTIRTDYTFQAAADGSGIAFAAAPTVGGNEDQGLGGGNEYLARRSSTGNWTQVVLSPENAPSIVFQAFSPDLTTAFVHSLDPLSSTAPGFGETPEYFDSGTYDVLYTGNTATGEYVPFFSTKPPYRTMVAFGTAGPFERPSGSTGSGDRDSHSGYLVFEGASANDSHLLFAANDALTGASEGRPAAEGGAGPEFESVNNLYDSVNGQLQLVNVLPDGTTHANAAFGGVEVFGKSHEKRLSLRHAISADGSRIFWTDLSSGHIYMRENGTRTVEISPQGTYQTSTSSGSIVLYTNGDLYSYDVENGQTTDLTPGVTVERVLGASEDGDYVYYVANGGETKLWHNGASTLIMKATPEEAPEEVEVTPDGHNIVFGFTEVLGFGDRPHHVYVYDADSGTLYCASCTSDGTTGALQVTNRGNVYQPRWISADGSRVFFVSNEGLVPQDTNNVHDVYEWERPGSGECTESAGCVYLLSGGTSTADSSFLDASESGNDLFIVTRAKLVSGDEDDLFDVYDVRVGSAPPTPPVCTGTGCQGVPSPPPIFATPSSVTFEGVGNFAAPAKETNAKPTPKKKPKPKSKKKSKKRKSKAKKSARKADGHKRSSSKGGRS
jgi:hypothetical protein